MTEEQIREDGWTDPARPPIEDAADLGGGVWASWDPAWGDGEHPSIWHWCSRKNWADRPLYSGPRWAVAGTRLHLVESRDPLHLEPSLLWSDCCGKHGWIRDGRWVEI